MPTPVQLGAAAGVVTATVIGGYTIYVVTSSGETITPIPFEANFDVAGSDYNGKLLSLIKKENVQLLVKPKEDKNKKWWEWAFENKFGTRKKDVLLNEIFSKVNKAYPKDDKDDPTALNNACHLAYKAESSQYKFDNSKNLINDISSFCTVSEQAIDISEPKATLHAALPQTGYELGILSVKENLNKLVTKDAANNLWWDWAFKNLWTNKNKDSVSDFQLLTKGYSVTVTSNKEIALNQVCDSAYKKGYTELKNSESKLLKNIKSFCSVDRSKNDLSLPVDPSIEPTDKVGLLKDVANLNTTHTGDLATHEANKSLLVDPTKSEKWWTWSFNERYSKLSQNKDNLPDIFKKVTKGFEQTATESAGNRIALNSACKDAYSKSKADLVVQTDSKKLSEFVLKLCAIGKATTLTVSN